MIPEVRACSTPAPHHPALPHQPAITRERQGPGVWVEVDPLPVVQTTETLEGRPRVTYRLTSEEQDQLEANLQQAGLTDVRLTPRRARAEAWS